MAFCQRDQEIHSQHSRSRWGCETLHKEILDERRYFDVVMHLPPPPGYMLWRLCLQEAMSKWSMVSWNLQWRVAGRGGGGGALSRWCGYIVFHVQKNNIWKHYRHSQILCCPRGCISPKEAGPLRLCHRCWLKSKFSPSIHSCETFLGGLNNDCSFESSVCQCTVLVWKQISKRSLHGTTFLCRVNCEEIFLVIFTVFVFLFVNWQRRKFQGHSELPNVLSSRPFAV